MIKKLLCENELTVLVRCSDDFRVFDLLGSIDFDCIDIIVGLTPNPEIEQRLKEMMINYAISPKGNIAKTTLNALKLVKTSKVLLVDSDCVFLPNSIQRLFLLAKEDVDIVSPIVIFEATDFSSYLTKIQRTFQYDFCKYIYEPGLLINLDLLLPKVGNYLFSEFAPFTPDGELDFRIRNYGKEIVIARDTKPTLLHRALSFTGNLKANWRYGYSDAIATKRLHHNILQDFFLFLNPNIYLRYP
jgi:hypothetical protein